MANYFAPGDQVVTEWGGGTVIGGVRGTTIKLDSGEVINIAHGTPGARRLREANADVKNAEQRAVEAANAAEAALGSHRRDYASSVHGRFEAPYYSTRGNRAVCTCGRTSHGRSAFQSLGLHIAAAAEMGDKVWNETPNADLQIS